MNQCTEPGCLTPVHARGLCNRHYRQQLKRQALKTANFCECGCGQRTLCRFAWGHHTRLFTSAEQSRRWSMRNCDGLRDIGNKDTYRKVHGRHEHRVVAEQMLGRPLTHDEVVHHKNGNKRDNRPDNLEVMTQSEHSKLHVKLRTACRQHFKPHPYQQLILEHLADLKRSNVWASMGLGKGTATRTHLAALYDLGIETMPTLVVAPLRVALSTWPDECAKWEHLKGLEVHPIIGEASQRARLLRRDAPIFSINYENLPWLIEHFKTDGRRWPFGTVIADESTRLRSTRVSYQRSQNGALFLKRSGGSVRGRALAEVAHTHVRRWINLTGKPAPNGLRCLWGQQFFVDAGERLGRTYSAFEQRWFQSLPGHLGYHEVHPLPHAQEQIQAARADCTLSIDAADWFDLQEPIVRPVYVDLPSHARRLYRDMERTMFMEIGEHAIEAVNAAARTMKALQLASGAVIVDEDGDWREVHDVKLQALEEIIEEAAGMPVLVAYHFRSDLARLQRAFPRGRVLDHNPQTLRDWNAGRIPVMFAHPASAGHGLNLQDGGNILAFFSRSWDLEAFQQIIERIGPMRQLQAGHDRPVFIYHIIARDTIDEDVLLRLQSKRAVQDLLLDAMKRRTSPARSRT